MVTQSVIKHYNTVKGKSALVWAWKGPEAARRLGLPNFKTIST